MSNKKINKSAVNSTSDIKNKKPVNKTVREREVRVAYANASVKPLYILLIILLCADLVGLSVFHMIQIKALTYEQEEVLEQETEVSVMVDRHFRHAAPINYDDILKTEKAIEVLGYYGLDVGSTEYFISDSTLADTALSQLGNSGYTYWNWYGCEYGTAWCAIFASWCANEAGYVDSGVCPSFSSVNSGIDYFKSNGQWASGNAVPSAGMYIFFDYDCNGRGDHVGIVSGCDGDIIYCVEGNYNDCVAATSYYVGDYSIMGYGMPNY